MTTQPTEAYPIASFAENMKKTAPRRKNKSQRRAKEQANAKLADGRAMRDGLTGRSQHFTFRCTIELKEAVKARAVERGISIAEYMESLIIADQEGDA